MATTAELTHYQRGVTDAEVIAGTLKSVREARFDAVLPQSALSYNMHGTVDIAVSEPIVTNNGVFTGASDTLLLPQAWTQMLTRLDLPRKYADKLRAGELPDGAWMHELLATNINELASHDNRTALYRFLQTDDEGMVLRAIMSDRYSVIDNDLLLSAILSGMSDNGLDLGECKLHADIGPNKLIVRVTIPQIGVNARELLGNYRSPYSNRKADDFPMMFAGLEFKNSETGQGTVQLAPRAEFEICSNGMTRPVEFKRTHIGQRMDEGVVDWSVDTKRKLYELIKSQVTDAVKLFTTEEYLNDVMQEMRAAKGIEVESSKAAIEKAADILALSDAEADLVFDAFAKGGDTTVLGLGQAVTAAAQRVDDGERQSSLEESFWQIVSNPQQFAHA